MSEKKETAPETVQEEKQGKSTKVKETIRVLKYALFAISAGVIETVSFTLMNELLNWAYWPSYLIALVLSVIWNFTFNRKYTYRAANNVPLAMMKTVLFYVVFTPVTMILGNYCDHIGVNHYLILIVTMALNFITEYLYQRFYTFKDGLDTNNMAEKAGEVNEENEANLEEAKRKDRKSMVIVTILSVVFLVIFVVLGAIFPSLYKLPHKVPLADQMTVTASNGTASQTASFDKKTDTLTIQSTDGNLYLDQLGYTDVETMNADPMLYTLALNGDRYVGFAYSETLSYGRIKKIVIKGGPNAGTYTFTHKNGHVSECLYQNGSKTEKATYTYRHGELAEVAYGDTVVKVTDDGYVYQTGEKETKISSSDYTFTKDKKHRVTAVISKKDGTTVTISYNDDGRVAGVKAPTVSEKLTYAKDLVEI